MKPVVLILFSLFIFLFSNTSMAKDSLKVDIWNTCSSTSGKKVQLSCEYYKTKLNSLGCNVASTRPIVQKTKGLKNAYAVNCQFKSKNCYEASYKNGNSDLGYSCRSEDDRLADHPEGPEHLYSSENRSNLSFNINVSTKPGICIRKIPAEEEENLDFFYAINPVVESKLSANDILYTADNQSGKLEAKESRRFDDGQFNPKIKVFSNSHTCCSYPSNIEVEGFGFSVNYTPEFHCYKTRFTDSIKETKKLCESLIHGDFTHWDFRKELQVTTGYSDYHYCAPKTWVENTDRVNTINQTTGQ